MAASSSSRGATTSRSLAASRIFPFEIRLENNEFECVATRDIRVGETVLLERSEAVLLEEDFNRKYAVKEKNMKKASLSPPEAATLSTTSSIMNETEYLRSPEAIANFYHLHLLSKAVEQDPTSAPFLPLLCPRTYECMHNTGADPLTDTHETVAAFRDIFEQVGVSRAAAPASVDSTDLQRAHFKETAMNAQRMTNNRFRLPPNTSDRLSFDSYDSSAAIFPIASFFNHSCMISCHFDVCRTGAADGAAAPHPASSSTIAASDAGYEAGSGAAAPAALIQIYAIRPIARGEQLTISYTSTHCNDRKARRASLEEECYFTCQCTACVNDLSVTSDENFLSVYLGGHSCLWCGAHLKESSKWYCNVACHEACFRMRDFREPPPYVSPRGHEIMSYISKHKLLIRAHETIAAKEKIARLFESKEKMTFIRQAMLTALPDLRDDLAVHHANERAKTKEMRARAIRRARSAIKDARKAKENNEVTSEKADALIKKCMGLLEELEARVD